jgi:hypothetical protein
MPPLWRAPRQKYSTSPKRVITLNGEYWALERVLRWSNRECSGHSMSFRSEELQAAIIPGRIFGLEVIVRIGELRYKEHKSAMQPAISEAVRNAIPDVTHQYCQYHNQRNVQFYREECTVILDILHGLKALTIKGSISHFSDDNVAVQLLNGLN